MIRTFANLCGALLLLALCAVSGCAAANFPSGAPALSGGMTDDPCRAMDRSLPAASLTKAKQTTAGPCKSDVLPGTIDALDLVAQPAKLSGLPVTLEVYYTSPHPVRVTIGPQNWVGYARAEQVKSTKLPAGDRVRAFVALSAWSTDPTENKAAAAKFSPAEANSALAGLVVHAWRLYPYGPPAAAKPMTFLIP